MVYRLGVDLGTTFTAAAIHRDGEVKVFPLSTDRAAVPSAVAVREDGSVVIGSAAERRAVAEPERIVREFKRRIGDPTPILVGGKPYPAHWFLARMLEWVLRVVTEREGEPPARVAVTHPANWRSFKTDLLIEAVRLAGLDPATTALLSEPEAAAISYAASTPVAEGEIIAVYDLGGGTFDAAVLRRDRTGFEILGSPAGVERLGGIDFDAALFDHVVAALGPAYTGLDRNDPAVMLAVARLRRDCTDAKEALSFDTDAAIAVVLPNHQTEIRVLRHELEALMQPGVTASIDALRRALSSAGVDTAGVSRVLLVGGSSRVPLVAQRVSAEVARPVAVDTDPKQAVAIGAAYAAAGTHYRTGGQAIRANAGFDLPTAAVPAGQLGTSGLAGDGTEVAARQQEPVGGSLPAASPVQQPWGATGPVPAPPPVGHASSTGTVPSATPPAAQPPWQTTGPPMPPAAPGAPEPASQAFWSTTTPPTPAGAEVASRRGRAEGHGRRILFIAIAAAVAVTVIGGGLLMRGLLQDREPTEVAADPVTPAPLAGWPGSLTVAVPAAGGTGDEWALASILADELGIAVEIDRLDGEAAVVDALRNQDADIGLLGPLTYVGATDDGVQILPVGIEAANASDTGYVRTFGITQASNAGIDSLEDAAGQVVCFADRSSTAGYQFPAAGLLEAGIDVGAQPSEVAGDHEAAVEFVANGTCPVGFALEEAVAGLVASGAVSGVVDATGGGDDINPAGAELKIIWKSDPITSDPMVVGTWLPQDLQDLIVDIVAEKANRDWAVGNGYCAAVSACTVNGGDAWGYMPATDADFEGYRQVCRLPELNGCELSSLG